MLLMERPPIHLGKDNNSECTRFVFKLPVQGSCANGLEAWNRARMMVQPEFDRLVMACAVHAEPEDLDQYEAALRKLQQKLDELKSSIININGNVQLHTQIEFTWSK